jgi:hypothetical protein
MKRLLLVAAAALSCTSIQAAPPNPKLVPADAKWAVHLDMEALLDASLVQKAVDRWMEEENGEFALNHVETMFGVDLREDVKGLTLYNTGFEEHEAVLLVNADFDQEKLLKIAKDLPDHDTEEVGSIEVHTWTDKEHGDRTVAGAFASDDLLVMASSMDLMKQALTVIEGDQDNLEGTESSLTRELPPGTVFAGGVVGLATADLPHEQELPEGLDEIAIAIGEHEDKTFVAGRVAAKNEATATNIKEIIEGARALVLLAHEVEADAKEYFRDATIEQAGGVVEFDVRLPADKLWEAMQKAEAEKKAKAKDKVKEKKNKAKDKAKEKSRY